MEKTFKILQKENKELLIIEYSEEEQKNFLKFIEKISKRNLKGVAIHSKMMLKIMDHFLNKGFKVIDVEFTISGLHLNGRVNTRKEKIKEMMFKESAQIKTLTFRSLDRILGKYISFSIGMNSVIEIKLGDVNYVLKEMQDVLNTLDNEKE